MTSTTGTAEFRPAPTQPGLSEADRLAHDESTFVRRPTAPLPPAARDALERSLAEADRLQLVEVAS